MTTSGQKTPGVYRKSDSFTNLSGTAVEFTEARERIRRLSDTLDRAVDDPERRAVVAQAITDVMNDDPDAAAFRLRPHIVAEIAALSDADLARYLFYRYRYDVYPDQKKLDRSPPCVQIEPTSICNYRCVFCYQTDKSFSQKSHGHMGHMPLDLFKRIVDQIEGDVEAVTLASRGEPLLCPDIIPMLEYAADKFLGLKINTNAWFLDEAHAHALLSAAPNTLVFSADAADADSYAKLRVNGKLDRIVENLHRFQDIRRKHYPDCKTITRVSGVRYSETQDFASTQKFWEAHVDQVAFVDYNPWENSYLMPPNGIETPCSDLWRRTFVWWDGRVNPCDVDYKSVLAVGSVTEQSLQEIWTGAAYQELRDRHISGCRQDVSPCSGCALV